ncbi:rho GTPase-activating protein 23-like isoform X2 [Takifugu rubripes]|uniref:rho GTPase-activating protein 23-like isoform X2 n=1 Tax=Takifugu rubripes TaxID=31033 RepID=UPI0011451FE0|nr:rho GTPase-activating protein 23-like isoform X2 [Takifugu rubripes]
MNTMDQPKEQKDGIVLTTEKRHQPLSSGEVENLLRPAPRTLILQKNSQDFGFTLRHFIVYPPGSDIHSIMDKENGNSTPKKSQYSSLKPNDTIFVKSVKENSPAKQAGLCEGDRLVKVNGHNILGKTYSQVMMLIQCSENNLELSVLPKDLDDLQMSFSTDLLKCNKSSIEETKNLPEGTTQSYKATKPTCSHSIRTLRRPLDKWQCYQNLTKRHLNNCQPPINAAISDWPGGLGDCVTDLSPDSYCDTSSSSMNALDFHFFNHNAAIASATLPPPRKSSVPAHRWPQADVLYRKTPSNWCSNRAKLNEHTPPYHSIISYDHLGPALRPAHSFDPSTGSVEYHKRNSLLYHHQAAATSNSPHWLQGQDAVPASVSQSWSKSLVKAYDEYNHNYKCSVKSRSKASVPILPYYKQSSMASKKILPPSYFPITSATAQSTGQKSGQIAEPQTRRAKEKPDSDESCNPFSIECHVMEHAQSFEKANHSGPLQHWHPADREITSHLSPGHSLPEEDKALISLRTKSTSRCQNAIETLQQPPNSTSLHSPKPHIIGPASEFSEASTSSKTNSSLAQHAFNLVSSIPLIGHIKDRRSSYMLAINTRRSKSFEEGLNTVREDSHNFFKLPKRVKSFFTYGYAASLQPQVEAWSKRHSTSDLRTVTFSDVCKQGWLHYKQVHTEKRKKAGGSMRPWKRVFSVLRAHSLFLYKDKREAVLHEAGSGTRLEDNPPISVHGCLIDIAYSDTKRKHTLRLTTQDLCEYLLQAEDQDDMMAWIQMIRENSKTDNEEISYSLSLINKKLNDNRKHSLTAGKPVSSTRTYHMMLPFLLTKTDICSMNQVSGTDDNKALWGISAIRKTKKPSGPKVFGIRLEDCQPAVNHKFVPLIVEICCGMVEASGLECTGIYRVPGNNAMVSNLQDYLNQGLDINSAAERWQDLNVISSVLKSFFRKLPEPLFTDDKYRDFIDANRIEDADNRLKTLNKLIQGLPDHYYHTLKFLVGHLKRVAEHSEKNKMEPRNLALVFGPTLVRTSEDKMIDMVTHMPDRYKIVETLILHHDWFFTNQCLDNKYKAPEDKQGMLPVPNIDHLLSNIGRPGMPTEGWGSTSSHSLKAMVPRLYHDSKTQQST